MEGKYDEEYFHWISKLKDTFSDNPEEHAVKTEIFDKLPLPQQELIDELPEGEKRKLADKAERNLADIGQITVEEEELLRDISNGGKQNYRQVICRLTGKVDLKRIMRGYNRLLEDYPMLRTAYLYRGLQTPYRVVYEKKQESFPIHDMTKANQQRLTFLLKNILASEMRRQFDIERDPVLRIQGYLTDARQMLVLISYYPHVFYPVGMRNMLYQIFGGMDAEEAILPGVSEETGRQMNEQLAQESVAYWKNILLPLGKKITLPGEKMQVDTLEREFREETVFYKEFHDNLSEKVLSFCEKNQVSVRSVFLYTWAQLLGRLHKEENPVLLVTGNGEQLKLFPIRAERKQPATECMKNLEEQIKEGLRYSNCTVKDMENACGISFSEYFRIAHNFVNFSELDAVESGKSTSQRVGEILREEIPTNLCINYYLFEHKMGMVYSAKQGFIEIILDNLHELFLDELSEVISVEREHFDRKKFLQLDDTEGDRLHKIMLAKTALYMKKSGIFETLTVEELIRVANYCKLRTYLPGDEVITQGGGATAFYIVGEGRLEESMTASDGLVKSLRIIGDGSTMGVECMLGGKRYPSTYTVVSGEAKVIQIDKNVLSQILAKRPAGMTALLKEENAQKHKLQRLWTME